MIYDACGGNIKESWPNPTLASAIRIRAAPNSSNDSRNPGFKANPSRSIYPSMEKCANIAPVSIAPLLNSSPLMFTPFF